ncbi:MAG TPA: hypothetical protein VL136_01875 [Candidatus Babeliales bacterium]|jgi:hypothetical protein|nr:hypothetical protein [Candidatus Babeliales bacterium]
MKTKRTATKKLKGIANLTKELPIRASTAFRIAGVAVTLVLAGFALSAGRTPVDSTKQGIAPGTHSPIMSPAILKRFNQPDVPTSAPYTVGDVFVGVGSGFIKHFSPAGVLLDTLVTSTGCNEDLGMAFTSTNQLLATAAFGACLGAGQVVEFDDMGNLIGPFGSGYSDSTESVVIDASGNVYVGQPDGTRALKKFDSTGTFLTDFFPATQNRGTDWNDLAADQCTMFYTSEGDAIKRFDVCTNTQLADFASSAAFPKYALRIRSNGEVLVAASSVLERYSPGGVLLQTYAFPETLSFAMNLDPDGVHFWTADYFSGTVYEYDIASGAIVFSFPSTPFTFASGLAIVGEPTAAGTNRCPLSQGYWKTHPAAWPVTSLTLGTVVYNQSQLLSILNTPGKGDASIILALQLIAAKLNIANGSDPAPIAATIVTADGLLGSCVLPCNVKPSSTLGGQMTAAAAILAQYNNGLLTPNCTP